MTASFRLSSWEEVPQNSRARVEKVASVLDPETYHGVVVAQTGRAQLKPIRPKVHKEGNTLPQISYPDHRSPHESRRETAARTASKVADTLWL